MSLTTLVWHDVVGTVGVSMIVVSYSLLQARKVSSDNPTFYVVNGIGAALILLSLTVEFNFSAVIMEGFWLLISLVGIWRTLRARRRGAD